MRPCLERENMRCILLLAISMVALFISACGGTSGGSGNAPEPVKSVGVESLKLINNGPPGLKLVATTEIDKSALRYREVFNNVVIKETSTSVSDEDFLKMKRLVDDYNLYTALRLPPNITSNPCHHEGMLVSIKKDGVLTEFPIHYYTICDTTTNTGLIALTNFLDGLVKKYNL